jgi:deoxyribonucleoside regulator
VDDLHLVVSVARLYYEKGLKQEEIARRVKISRASVSLILAEARRKGIVEITIRNPLENHRELSQALASRFGLKRCVVVPTAIRETEVLIDLTASRAAAPAMPSCPATGGVASCRASASCH